MERQLLTSDSNYFEHAIITTAENELRMNDAFELCILLQGECHVRSYEKDILIKENDIFFFPSQVPYSIECHGNSITYYQIRIFDRYLELFYPEPSGIHYETYSLTRSENKTLYDKLCNRMASVLFLSLSDHPNRSLEQLTDLNHMLLSIDKEYEKESSSQNSRSNTEITRINQILTIVKEHYREKLRLEDISAMLGFHPQYFSSYFTSVFHEKYTDYINRYRVNQSLQDLIYSQKTLLDIALDHGFQSSKSYCNSFKKYYGELPSAYRQTHRRAADFDSESAKDSLIQQAGFLYSYYVKLKNRTDESIYQPEYKEETPVPLSLELSMKHPEIIATDRRIRSICISSLSFILQDDVYHQLELLKNTTGFTYVHCRDIFSDYFQVYTEPFPDSVMYFFGDLSRALDRILSLGLIPFLEIGYMPSDLSSFDSHLYYSSHPQVSPPKDMKKWKDLVRAFLLHCKATYGEAIYQWKFDFWNTANLNMKNGYWGGTKEEFFELYKETWDVFQEVDSRLTIGTPNFSLPDGIDWYEDFLDFCKKESIMPSHLAIHIYSCMDNLNDFHGIFPYPETSYNYLSLTTREFINNLIYFLGRVSKKHGFENLPIIASEWNITYYLSDLIRDTAFMATYIAHTYIQTISTIDGLSFSCLSDINDQFRPSSLLFNGDEGLFTYQGIPKPAYHAFSLLHKLDAQVVGCDANSYIVTRSSRGFHVLVYNMAEYDKLPKDQILSYITPDRRYQIFRNTVPIHFHGVFHVKQGSYTIKTYTFDRKHGTFYDIWLLMGKPQQLSQEMVDMLKRNSYPFMHYERKHDTSLLTLDATISAHGITLFEVKLVS